MSGSRPPRHRGLYDPALDHDACGVGFVAHIKGERSHQLLRHGLAALVRLEHRGACGCDPETGDGAGILIQLPDGHLRRAAGALGIDIPAPGAYAAGIVFLDRDDALCAMQSEALEAAVGAEGQRVLGWRPVPHQPDAIGRVARESLPTLRQLFVGAAPGLEQDAFERKLYVIRRRFEKAMRESDGFCYVASLSSRTLLFTGLLTPSQLAPFYPDLSDPELTTALALIHSRFSTNTLGAWDLAQPFRYLAHNGEINTLRGNRHAMRAREGTMRSPLFGDDLEKLYPILRAEASDSAQFDNALEFLCLTGRELPEAILMMIPEAWENYAGMDPDLRAYYEYHSFLLEPWDGPASIAFTDGRKIGAVLDRNGLRPSRWIVTDDDLVVMASEVGVLDIPPERVVRKGRLQPGRIFFVDLERGRIVEDEEIKADYVRRRPYREWTSRQRLLLHELPAVEAAAPPLDAAHRIRLQQVFGYSQEDLRFLIAPMIADGKWAIGSMGADEALACLSDRPRPLYHYFKQLFAQVTNPAMDSINEGTVMSLYTTLGAERNLLAESEDHARLLRCNRPILTDRELAVVAHLALPGFRSQRLATLFKVTDGGVGLRTALAALCDEAEAALRRGVTLLILSDRDVTPDLAPIPMLLATGAVHHHLVRRGLRTQCGLLCETGEARDVAQFALLLGYGAGAINPYLALQTVAQLVEDEVYTPEALGVAEGIDNYLKACDKGLLKTMAKMGISTLQSYRGAQIFEAVGLDRELVDQCFAGTASRISGVGFDVLAEEAAQRHRIGFAQDGAECEPELDPGGIYQWRRRGERHAFHPDAVARLQHAVRDDSYATFEEFSRLADEGAERLCTLRGLFRFRGDSTPVPLAEVEPCEAILTRFCTGAMSYGSISLDAHESLAIAMNRIGGKSNTGEGGEDPRRFTPDPSGDSRRSAIKQVASGRFGVTSWYLVNADELQIKIAQGAKPGEGGELPGHKVDETIAKTRHSTPGVGLISPPPHHDIYSIEDLAQLIYDLKNANRRARVSVKLVSETGVGTIAAGVSKGKADGVLISGHDGGTGASPQASIKYAGLPWEIGLAETQQVLVANDLRGRIRVQADGGLKTSRDVVIAALLGADEFGFSTAPLIALGCILMRVCHLNTCPVGIATQNPELRARFAGLPDHVVRYFHFVATGVREHMAALGFRRMDEMVGRVDRLEVDRALQHGKAQGLDFSELLYKPQTPHAISHCQTQSLAAELETVLDATLLELARPALEEGRRVEAELPIHNTDRTVGTILGSEVSRRYGEAGLPEDTLTLRFRGSAGQSFGAFLPHGVSLWVEGDTNDYCGKGLCGGKIVVRAPREARFDPAHNVITGNVVLYGATAGEAYFQGTAGERFAVRNSGAQAVVEGVGDHGCEYMTGGQVVVLGPTGRNFAAGMSGGMAYVLDLDSTFAEHVNALRVDLDTLDRDDEEIVQRLVRRHRDATGSRRADDVLRKWNSYAPQFVKVWPKDLKMAVTSRLAAAVGDG